MIVYLLLYVGASKRIWYLTGKCHFMMKKVIVRCHVISKDGIQVHNATVDLILIFLLQEM